MRTRWTRRRGVDIYCDWCSLPITPGQTHLALAITPCVVTKDGHSEPTGTSEFLLYHDSNASEHNGLTCAEHMAQK